MCTCKELSNTAKLDYFALELATRFAIFFSAKIETILAWMRTSSRAPVFHDCTRSRQRRFLKSANSASRQQHIALLINCSISSGVVLRSMKHADITPLAKKPNIDPDNMKQYRPISNLSFVSKLFDRHVARCLLEHANKNDLLDRNQSAYRPYHSKETEQVIVQNDIPHALDRRQGVIHVLFDMSAHSTPSTTIS